jgi:hypothetical protein
MIKTCSICEKKFKVKVDEKGRLLNCIHYTIDLNHFKYWTYRVIEFDPFVTKIMFAKPIYKYIFFLKPVQEIFYFFWKIFHKKRLVEIWECSKCSKI